MDAPYASAGHGPEARSRMMEDQAVYHAAGPVATINIVGECPQCTGQVKVGAAVCPYCGSVLHWPQINIGGTARVADGSKSG